MNLERGFRRITLVISLAAVIGGLVVTVYVIYRTVIYVSGMREFMTCSEDPKVVGGACLDILVATAVPDPFRRFISPTFGEESFWFDRLLSLLSLFLTCQINHTAWFFSLSLRASLELLSLVSFLGASFTWFAGLFKASTNESALALKRRPRMSLECDSDLSSTGFSTRSLKKQGTEFEDASFFVALDLSNDLEVHFASI